MTNQHSARLMTELAGYGPTMVLFSGGVDSALVVAAAARALGADQVVALTARSPAVPAQEVEAAAAFALQLGVPHELVATTELDVAGYRRNGPDRCAFCKSTLVEAARLAAARLGIAVLATGTNATDIQAGFRPGIAAAATRGVRTPLADLALTKTDVRAIARLWQLPVWDKPAAACLASRISYGIEVTAAGLARIGAAEDALHRACRRAGIPVRNLRVRDLGQSVRVEDDHEHRDRVASQTWLATLLASAGFAVPVTVESFRSGAMNELLPDPEKWRHR
jgi:uncharacterized protein